MMVIDRLSATMGVSYADLYQKTIVYHGPGVGTQPEEKKVKLVFTDKERDFLACFALEYLRKNGGGFIPEAKVMNPDYNHSIFGDESV